MDLLLNTLTCCLFLKVINASKNTSSPTRSDGLLTDDMIKGFSAGFGFFIALIVLICLVWYCCCAESTRSNAVSENNKNQNIQNSNRTAPRNKHSQNGINHIEATELRHNSRRVYS